MEIDLANLRQRDIHHTLMSVVVPRPIAWISTVGEDGVFNLAPFSAYSAVSIKPAMVGFCVAATRDGRKKDTLRNIESTKEFVINVVDETLAEPMNVTSAPYPSDVDEFKEAGLTAVKASLPLVIFDFISFSLKALFQRRNSSSIPLYISLLPIFRPSWIPNVWVSVTEPLLPDCESCKSPSI